MNFKNTSHRTITIISAALFIIGCSTGKKETEPSVSVVPSGPPRHWDIGDQTLKHKLPEDVSDGYLQFARTATMSYGMTLAHDRISARSHAKADMLIYIHSGTARFRVDDMDLTGSMGDLIFVPRGSVYSVESLSNRQLQLVTMYSPALDSADVIFHEAAERVKTMVPRLTPNQSLLDTFITLKPKKDDSYFEKMQGSIPVEEVDKGK